MICKTCNKEMDYEDFGDDDCRKMCYVCNDCDLVVRDF